MNTKKDTITKPEEVRDLQATIDILKAEKMKLEVELRSREEMMSNLLSYIQAPK